MSLSQKYQKTPTIDEIAEYLDSTPEEVMEAMEASKVYTPQSLDVTYESGDESEVNLSDLIGVEEAYFDKIESNDFFKKSMELSLIHI